MDCTPGEWAAGRLSRCDEVIYLLVVNYIDTIYYIKYNKLQHNMQRLQPFQTSNCIQSYSQLPQFHN